MATKRECNIMVPQLDKYTSESADSKRVTHAQLCIDTTGEKGVIHSVAMLQYVGDGFVTFVVFQDYYLTLEKTWFSRATQKKIDEQHARWVTEEQVSMLTDRAIAYYANKFGGEVIAS